MKFRILETKRADKHPKRKQNRLHKKGSRIRTTLNFLTATPEARWQWNNTFEIWMTMIIDLKFYGQTN